MLHSNIATRMTFLNMKYEHEQAIVHIKAKETKMPICKRFQCRSKFACLYNSMKRLFPFMRSVRICRPFFHFCMRPRAKPVFVALLHYARVRIQWRTKRVIRIIVGWTSGWMTSPTKENAAANARSERLVSKQRLYFSTVRVTIIFLTYIIIYIINKNKTNITIILK